MGELLNRKWTDDNPLCPNGHQRTLCEIKTIKANGQIKYECSIRRKAKEGLRAALAKEHRLNIGRPGTLPLIAGDIPRNSVLLILVCGHHTFQLTKSNNHLDQHWCQRHEEWFSVHSVTQWGQTTEMTPLLSRHEIYGCTTKTGCTYRCKSSESPPTPAAIISRNNKSAHAPSMSPSMLRGKVLA